MNHFLQKIRVIDSHTAGEPTRLVIDGGPDLGNGRLPEQVRAFRETYDSFRNAVIREPRGSEVLVGALLCRPSDHTCVAGVIFFNNAGYLGMCGHGTMGVIASLAHIKRIQPGTHRLETPVGLVNATLHESGEITVVNVPSYRTSKDVVVSVPGVGDVCGDVAWGGNWFFLVEYGVNDLDLSRVEQLTNYARKIRQALADNNITGENGEPIDHIELFKPMADPAQADSKNFVLCPGDAYDRSPCGTGTSAKLACLYADGRLKPGEVWRQQGILDTVFRGSVAVVDGKVVPSITGSAYVTAEATLILDPNDPFRMGIPQNGFPGIRR